MCARAYNGAMTDDVKNEVLDLIQAVHRHQAVLSIAIAAEDGLAASIATLRARAALQRLAAMAAGDRVTEAGVVDAIKRTLSNYERLRSATAIIATVDDRIRIIRWLEHRSRRELDLFELRAHDKHLGLVSFANLHIANCELKGVSLAGSLFDGAVLNDCDFSMCVLVRTSWLGARVTRCIFTDTDLIDSCLDGAQFVDCTFLRSDLGAANLGRQATARQTQFIRCDLRSSAWHERVLAGTKFDACSFHDVHGRPLLEGIEIEQPDLSPSADRSHVGSSRDVIGAWCLRGGALGRIVN